MRAWLPVVVLLLVAACDGAGEPAAPVAVPLTEVVLAGGADPAVLVPVDDGLVVGARRDGHPALIRLAADGGTSDLAVRAASPYGREATWQAVSVHGTDVLALGGERGGAHGHVRWSVWDGSLADGVTERVQGFSVFGGYSAGDLVGAVRTPSGPVVVGAWESAQVGFDIATWTADGDVWTRQSSAGTALESRRGALNFPLSAAADGQGIVVAGWQLTDGRQQPAVWTSAVGTGGWTLTLLPDAGSAGAAVAVSCRSDGCAVTGWVDGTLAVWHRTGDSWTRVHGAPPVPVGDTQRLAAPVDLDGTLAVAVPSGDTVTLARLTGDTWTTRQLSGPTGQVTALAALGDTLYLLAGQPDSPHTLWRADLAVVS
jgi:hypothetical protein